METYEKIENLSIDVESEYSAMTGLTVLNKPSIVIGEMSQEREILENLEEYRARTSLPELIDNSKAIVGETLKNTVYVNRAYHRTDASLLLNIDKSCINVELNNKGMFSWAIRSEQPLHLRDIESSSSIMLQTSGKMTMDEARKLKHDLVCEALTADKTDVRLHVAFPDVEFECSKAESLTPDIAFMNAGKGYVIEVATNAVSQDSNLKSLLNTKLQKYAEAFPTSTPYPIFISAVVVSFDRVYSNIILPQELCTLLVAIYRLGAAIESVADSQGIPIGPDYSCINDQIIAQIKYDLMGIETKSDDTNELAIDQLFIKRALEEPDQIVIKGHLETIIKETRKKYFAKKPDQLKDEDMNRSFTWEANRVTEGKELRHHLKPVTQFPL